MKTEKNDAPVAAPFEHPSFARYRGSAKYLAALARAEVTGESVADAMNGIALDAIRDGREKPLGILSRLASALKGEKTAAEELEKALAQRAEAEALDQQWKELLRTHLAISSRVATALEWLSNIKNRIVNSEGGLALNIGDTMRMNEDQALSLSQEIACAAAGLPYLEKAIEKVRGELRAHVAQMHAWGSKNGVEKETLAHLLQGAR